MGGNAKSLDQALNLEKDPFLSKNTHSLKIQCECWFTLKKRVRKVKNKERREG